jgi:hypothetical protein
MIEIAVLSGIIMTALISIYALYKINTKTWLIIILAPWILFSAGFGFLLYEKIKGYATEEPIKDSRILYYSIAKPRIYLLVINEKVPRLHVVPYNKDLENRLENANAGIKQGRHMRIRQPREGDSVLGLSVYEFDHKQAFPKNQSK